MKQSLTADFLIIGAGAAGLSLARELSEFSRVIVIEKERSAGYHASGRSAAIFVDSYGDRVVQALSAASRAQFCAPPFVIDGPLLRAPRGILYLARTTSASHSVGHSRAAFPRLSPREVRAMVPIIREEVIGYAHWEECAADIDVHMMLTGLIRRIKERAGQILIETPLTAGRRDHGLWTLTAGDKSIVTPTIINTAGAWAATVGILVGATELPLVPLRRTAATIAPPTGFDVSAWPMVVDVEETIYFKADAGALMLSPADETPVAPHDAFAEDIDVATAVDRFESLTNHTVRKVRSQWAGLRTVAPDRRPVIGFDAKLEGLFWLAGQGGFGIQTAFGAASLSRHLLMGAGAELPDTLAGVVPLLSPGRFA